ncbi:hypothetical protein GCM10010211_70310 [Streptomyces albospinus]|uniref:Uncharacterized protein n=1 Tax=Streptomyces albospinus TaxID=285515 RepID=A0ABQ2VK78_9ACTN|nr:hypothetical protein [Streptomyces albospinus]GGU93365.1 hypothetical protein GCM10010211_70310 [Streptomyces albospinus]
MSDEHRSAEDTAARPLPCDEERRLARQALAGRARDAGDLALLMDMLGLDPSRDPGQEAARGQERAHGQEPARGRQAGRGRGAGRERRNEGRRDTCRGARTPSADPG